MTNDNESLIEDISPSAAMLQFLTLKHQMNPYGKGEQVVYELTQDQAQIFQYQRLAWMEHGEPRVDAHDAISLVFVARRGNLCLGGARVIVREQDEDFALPMEKTGFDLRATLDGLELFGDRHAEISRFAMMEDCGVDVFSGLAKAIIDHLAAAQVPFAFIASSLVFARAWNKAANALAGGSTEVRKDVTMPQEEDSEVNRYLTVMDLSRYCAPEKSGMRRNAQLAA